MKATPTPVAMATSSILGGEQAARRAPGRDNDSLGPSDSSDSGSDTVGERRMPTLPDNPGETGAVPSPRDSDSDAGGTGERGAAEGNEAREGGDILPDHVIGGKTADAADELESLEVDAADEDDPSADS